MLPSPCSSLSPRIIFMIHVLFYHTLTKLSNRESIPIKKTTCFVCKLCENYLSLAQDHSRVKLNLVLNVNEFINSICKRGIAYIYIYNSLKQMYERKGRELLDIYVYVYQSNHVIINYFLFRKLI